MINDELYTMNDATNIDEKNGLGIENKSCLKICVDKIGSLLFISTK